MIAVKKMILRIDGMMCGMCESHINDAIRRALPVQKVTSSHTKGETVILSESDVSEEKLREVIDATGYRLLAMRSEPYQKKGIFARLFGSNG